MEATVMYLTAVFALLSIGLYCIAVKRNMIRILIGIDMVFNSANLTFIYFASHRTGAGLVDPLGQSIVFMSITLGGCFIAVGLAMVVNAYKQFKMLDVRELRRLKW